MFYKIIFMSLLGLISYGCNGEKEEPAPFNKIEFETPKAVTVQGYNGHIMEPFLSRTGDVLFFNNQNIPSVNTNLHWCTRVDDTTFEYQGELLGVNTQDLEGVPTMDMHQQFYFVYTGMYEETLSTIYKGIFEQGHLSELSLVENISRKKMGWVNFDVEVSNDGQTLYFVDGRFDANGGPHEANFVIAKKTDDVFERISNSETIMQHINSNDLEYAAAVTKDELEICFTRVSVPLNSNSEPHIYIANRATVDEPFSNVQMIEAITGFVEAPTYAPDDKGIYFHKKENGEHVLYYVRKK